MPYKYVTNYTVNGSPTVDANYIASGFSSSNYFTKPSAFMPSTSTWEIGFKVKTSSTLGVQNFLLGSTPQYYYTVGGELMNNNYFGFGFSSNGSSWDIGWVSGTTQVSANTWYWIRISFDGTTYKFELSTDGENYNLEGSVTNSNAIYQNSTNSIMNLGTMGNRNTYWRGDIDLKEWYIKEDGNITWQAVSYVDVSGSIDISKGYYNDGTHTIIMPAGQHYLSDLTTGQTLGCKNNLFATSYNDVATPVMSSLNAPTGTYDVYVNLNHPVYLSYEKNYIAGDKLMSGVAWSFEKNATDYTVVGSPTISSDYVASGFSDNNYLTTINFNTSSDYEIHLKAKRTGDSTGGYYPLFFGVIPCGIFLGHTHQNKFHIAIGNGSSWPADADGGTMELNVDYYIKLVKSGSSIVLSTSLDGTNWTTQCSVSSSASTTQMTYIGKEHPNSSSFFTGEIDLKECYIIQGGVEVWRAVIPASVSASKSLLYNTTQDSTYWLPSAQTVLLSSLTSSDLLTRNNLYLTNTTGSDVSAFTFRMNAPSTTEYWQQPEYVYLTQDKTQILGVGTEPDEIVLEATSSAAHYTVVGSPTIDSNNVASGFSSSSYLTFENPTTTFSSLEYNICITTPSSWSSSVDTMLLGINSSDYTGFMIAFGTGHSSSYQAGKMLFFVQNVQGSSWTDTGNMSYTFSTNTKYYIRIAYNSGSWTISYSTNGTSYTQIGTLSKTLSSLPSTLLIGNSTGSWGGNNPFMGSIHLADTYMLADGVEVWRAAGGPDTITVDPVHYWSYYGTNTVNLQGVSEAISGFSPSSLTGHLMGTTAGALTYSENNAQGEYGGSGAYWTGYDLTFTDNTYTEIDSVTKTGELCRVYHYVDGTPGHESTANGYIYVPYRWWSQLQRDPEPSSYTLPFSTSSLLLTSVEISPSSTITARYYKSTDAFIDPVTQETAEYIGDYYFISNLY